MAGSVNKVILVDQYQAGASLTELASKHGLSVSTVRLKVKEAGALRSRAEGVRLAAEAGRLGSGFRGRARCFSDTHRAAISRSRTEHAEQHAAGLSHKASGYVEITRGPNKGRGQHVIIMEKRLGRRLLPDEIVHHVDGDRGNNSINNLALMTRSAHTRLHRREDRLAKGSI